MNKGVAVLPAVLIFGAIMIGIVISGLMVAQTINRSNFGIRIAAEAEAAARAAIEDVHLKILRNSLSPEPVECNDSSPVFTPYDAPDLGRIQVDAEICKYSCGLDICRYRVRANAQSVFFVKRQLEALIDVDPVTGQTRISSLKQLSF
ncbi:MAG: hypothetical protein ABH822_00315 [Patescibacteria group bacterium]